MVTDTVGLLPVTRAENTGSIVPPRSSVVTAPSAFILARSVST